MSQGHVIEWQRAIGVTADGDFGPGTLKASLQAIGKAPVAQVAPAAPSVPSEWDARSAGNLKGVHPDLVKIMTRALEIAPFNFIITEGVRTVERQKQLVAIGDIATMNSRHIPGKDGLGKAVDIVPYVDIDKDGKVETHEMYDWPLYHKLAPAVKQAAKELGIPIEWGGDWRSFKDGPHWQLPAKLYP